MKKYIRISCYIDNEYELTFERVNIVDCILKKKLKTYYCGDFSRDCYYYFDLDTKLTEIQEFFKTEKERIHKFYKPDLKKREQKDKIKEAVLKVLKEN
jgi:hypothetical protein